MKHKTFSRAFRNLCSLMFVYIPNLVLYHLPLVHCFNYTSLMVVSLTAELLFCLGTFTFASPLVRSGSNQSILQEISWRIFIGRTNAETETPILWPPDVKD